MIILGINDGHHAGAALVADGRLVAAISEERLSRRKCEYGFPENAISEVLKLAGVTSKDIDSVAVSTRRLPPKYFLTKRNTTFSLDDYWREQVDYWGPRLVNGRKVSYLEVFADKAAGVDNPYDMSCVSGEDDDEGMMEARMRLIVKRLDIERSKISFLDHASCHAYYAYLSCPDRTKPLTVLVADGFGDGANGSIWLGRPGGLLEPILRTGLCNIGRIYRYITLLLGMKPNEHEFKVMGLAPYSNQRYAEKAYRVLAETLQVDGIDFSYKTKPSDHFFYFRDRLGACRFDAIAHALQQRTEELLLTWMRNAVAKTGAGDLCLSGGVALNVKANMLIAEDELVRSLFVPPGPNDESLPIGAAFYALATTTVEAGLRTDELMPFSSPYLGKSYDDKACSRAIEAAKLSGGVQVRRAAAEEIADILSGNSVVARFAGQMEFGPRALGNRSILADPRQPDAVRLINQMIKKRDFWMPFCPSILESRAADYLRLPDKPISTEYMSVGFRSTPLGRQHLPAALHPYDNSARPQTVNRLLNPGYHDLISAFEARTGVGCLLNTSFNLHGEPIVESPADALRTFLNSGLPHLALGSWLLSKPLDDEGGI